MSVDSRERVEGAVLPITIEQRGGELWVEACVPLHLGGVDGFGWQDPHDPELVLVGENLFLRGGRFGAFATEATVQQVIADVRAAHRDFEDAARD